ncbi:ParB/RepB/Spo0J family partition protein [Streptomyces sp. HUAS TT20]|uniref:ParB/RepB/Spo0J family partition protein n=1 Tax=Streptomyces sp. HUAS TT20 TaxID=3447509 RepID=UPI0021DA44F3|nr:ParB N-terminal domain-containing protein [Streptomyces sp. HUAS 15-9]UXY30456.1 ParB N-terminal domain-containing protein [Streptomyces sp. HUAS 15-9]
MIAVHFEPPLRARTTREPSTPPRERGRHPDLPAVTTVPIALLLPADSPRLSGENLEHAHTLAASEQELPPIIVHRQTMRVIDGMHRLRVAVLRGQPEIRVRFFEGSAADAFVLAVKSNVGHGLPLTLTERVSAAERIIASHAQWSDRVIASATGLSATTVGGLRRRRSETGTAPASRIGRDGRVRPLSTAEGRRTAGRLIAASPDAPLREIAKQANLSLGTVRDVRNRVLRGEDPVPAPRRAASRQRTRPPAQNSVPRLPGAIGEKEQPRVAGPDAPSNPSAAKAPGGGPQADLTAVFKNLCGDPSLRYTETGRLLLRMLETQIAGVRRWDEIAESVPSHRAAMVSAAATECASAWQKLARKISQQSPA